jgi:hypothetical protein
MTQENLQSDVEAEAVTAQKRAAAAQRFALEAIIGGQRGAIGTTPTIVVLDTPKPAPAPEPVA